MKDLTLLNLWILNKKNHLVFCDKMGIIYSPDSITDQLKLLQEIQFIFQLNPEELNDLMTGTENMIKDLKSTS